MRLRYLAAAPLVAVAMFGTTAAAWPSSTAAVPQAPPALTASALSDRYTAEARAIKTTERAALRHRDRVLPGSHHRRADPRRQSSKAVNDFRTYAFPDALGGDSHFCHARPGVCYAILWQ